MRKIIVSSNVLQIRTPEKTNLQTPNRPGEMWLDASAGKLNRIVPLTEQAEKFVEAAKLNPHILVYR